MFCGKCGSKLPEGSVFCGVCGADLSASKQNNAPVFNQPQPVNQSRPVNQPSAYNQSFAGPAYFGQTPVNNSNSANSRYGFADAASAYAFTGGTPSQPSGVTKQKSNGNKLVPVIAVAVVLVLVAGIVGAVLIFGGNLEKKIIGKWTINMTDEQIEEIGDDYSFLVDEIDVEFESDGTGEIDLIYDMPIEWELDGKELTIEMDAFSSSDELQVEVRISGDKMTWISENGEKIYFERD